MTKEFIQVEPSLIGGRMGRVCDETISCVEAGAEMLHLDVMDGHFVPNFTMGPATVLEVRKVVTKEIFLDCHLMIYQPDAYIEKFIESGADGITFHLEATEDVEFTLDYIKKCGKRAGLAIKPETSVEMLFPYLGTADLFLIMTVQPGFGGQSFMPDMLEKVKLLRAAATRINLKPHIQVDGGIDYDTGKQSVEAGANLLVSGSHFFKQPDRKQAVEKYNSLRKVRSF